jgi:hypothetical protein
MNPFRIFPLCFLNIRLVLILSDHLLLGLPSGLSFPSGYVTKAVNVFPSLPLAPRVQAVTFLTLIILTVSGEAYKL